MEEVQEIPTLFEVFWFYHNILPKAPPPSSRSLPPNNKSTPIVEKTRIEKAAISRLRSVGQESLSGELSSESDSTFSPSSVLPAAAKLNKILLGKEAEEVVTEKMTKQEAKIATKRVQMVGRRNKLWGTKSLSDLELEELEGFKDLGFAFPAGEIDSRLISIVPGLRRVGKKAGDEEEEEEEEVDESAVSRPYLSEVWAVDRRRLENPLITNWRVPVGSNATDMKNNLKLWAHTVASTVKSS